MTRHHQMMCLFLLSSTMERARKIMMGLKMGNSKTDSKLPSLQTIPPLYPPDRLITLLDPCCHKRSSSDLNSSRVCNMCVTNVPFLSILYVLSKYYTHCIRNNSIRSSQLFPRWADKPMNEHSITPQSKFQELIIAGNF